MYEAKKAFIYRAKLYSVGQEITPMQYGRMMRDKGAMKRGIPEMVAPQVETKVEQAELPVIDKAEEAPVVTKAKPKRKPGRPKKTDTEKK